MKITAVLGSPRIDSNSTKLAEAALRALEADKPEIKKFILNDLKIKGCQGCYSCKGKTETCAYADDIFRVLASAADCDMLILSGPIYIGDVISQLKAFIDRCFSWLKPNYLNQPQPSRLSSGKKLLFIVTQGNPDPDCYSGVLKTYQSFFERLGFTVNLFVASGLAPGALEFNDHLLKEVAEMAMSW
ncbi:MAG: flavodoxin family protein [Deltaproteobacteria bacterium]|jgi:multimeric flavodoxin WrbA|nr:flavodoxin family protein [Deltaproteobacteria bacterium]